MSETNTVATSGVNIFDAFETDISAEENGKWFEDILGDGTGLGIKVRHMGSQVATKNIQRLMQANRKLMVKGKLPPEVDKRVFIEHLSQVVLIDWKGFLDKDNAPLPYSPENAAYLLEKLPKFREAVVRLSQSMDAFRVEATEEIAGN